MRGDQRLRRSRLLMGGGDATPWVPLGGLPSVTLPLFPPPCGELVLGRGTLPPSQEQVPAAQCQMPREARWRAPSPDIWDNSSRCESGKGWPVSGPCSRGSKRTGLKSGLNRRPFWSENSHCSHFCGPRPAASLSRWVTFTGKEARVGDVCAGAGACVWGTHGICRSPCLQCAVGARKLGEDPQGFLNRLSDALGSSSVSSRRGAPFRGTSAVNMDCSRKPSRRWDAEA